jgi:hypothetical protein
MFPVPIADLELGAQAANKKTPTMAVGKNLSSLFKCFLLGINFFRLFPKGIRIDIGNEAPNGLWRVSNYA